MTQFLNCTTMENHFSDNKHIRLLKFATIFPILITNKDNTIWTKLQNILNIYIMYKELIKINVSLLLTLHK